MTDQLTQMSVEQPTIRVADQAEGLSTWLRRMGTPTLSSYALYSLLTGVAQRRRGLTGVALRRALYGLMLGQSAKPVILEDVTLRGPSRIFFERGVVLEQQVLIDAKTNDPRGVRLGERTAIRVGSLLDTGYAGHITVGGGTTIGAYSELRGAGGLTIGRDCLFARNVSVLSSDHVMDDPTVPVTEQGIIASPTVLGDGVWLGANVVVKGGVSIGEGAVIGANSVVTRDVPAGAVMVGAPARLMRLRPGFAP
jgi:acetyltransferase-like isoleucine patch superfamily enzyme